MTTINLHDSFKAYDVRGIVGETITAETVKATGAASLMCSAWLVRLFWWAVTCAPPPPNSWMHSLKVPPHAAQMSKKSVSFQPNVLYFACGIENAAGVTFTASHNPAEYNGMKMAKAGAVPVSSETGLFDIRDLAQKYLDKGSIPTVENPGVVTEKDVLKAYAEVLA